MSPASKSTRSIAWRLGLSLVIGLVFGVIIMNFLFSRAPSDSEIPSDATSPVTTELIQNSSETEKEHSK